ncbi:MAG TPA: glycine/sarcosine/betaine reductase selenoprotein B family protein [Pyrinomonadaceae bacterium]|nr:glycine/sarcosine/betaine reductase selenoprotein B family protein [Pyrinomonadaceae bacterium]
MNVAANDAQLRVMIEHPNAWRTYFERWKRVHEMRGDDVGAGYPWVENKHAPFRPARRALPMLNLALISSAGAYIDGSEPFDTGAAGGDTSFREIPVEVEARDLKWAARGYDPRAVEADMNAQAPVARLLEFEGNGIIGQLNPVWWSLCGFITDARRFAEEAAPRLVERVMRYEAQAALLVPASRLCHQTMALLARAVEAAGVPTMMLAVDRDLAERVRPPRAAYYAGEFGCVVGKPDWPEYQRRVLDESLRLIEPIDQPGVRNLVVALGTEVEMQRGEK